MDIPCPAPPFQSISLYHCPLRCSELILTCTGGPGSSRLGLCEGSLMPTPCPTILQTKSLLLAPSQAGPQTTKSTYLGLPFALAGAACVLVGGPLCGLWEEHTDITWLCHSPSGQAAVGAWSGQEAGKGSGTACRVRIPHCTQKAALSSYRDL